MIIIMIVRHASPFVAMLTLLFFRGPEEAEEAKR